MGIAFTVIGYLLAAALLEVAVSCLAREAAARWPALARGRDVPVPDGGLALPGACGALATALLALLGALPALWGALLSAALLAATAWPVAREVLRARRAGEKGALRRAAGFAFLYLPRAARQFLAADLRLLAGGLRRPAGGAGDPAAGPAPRPAGTRPAGPPRWPASARARAVPPLMEDPYLGAHPYPADVAASLEMDRVPVPPHWERLAQVISDFDPEDDDDTQGHLAGEAAGVLAVSVAVENRADHLGLAVGLDPAIIEAHWDIAEGFAELATRYALLVRRDHLVMGDLREFADNGGVIPHDGRRYMNAGDPRPGGDRAA